MRLIWRFRKKVALFVLAGLIVGGAWVALRPPAYQATSLVLLPATASSAATGSSSSGSSFQAPTANDVNTDAGIATSGAVLMPAGRQVDPSLSLSQLQALVSTNTAVNGVLGITASGRNAQMAERLANAVAEQLVSFVTSNSSTASSAVVTSLQAEAAQLNAQLQEVQNELNAANQRLQNEGLQSSAGQQDAQLVANLTNEQSNLVQQLDGVKSQISQTKLGIVSANEGTQVLQRATTASGRSATGIALVVLLGGLGGLIVGVAVVLIMHRRDRRLWSRHALAEAVGSPVLLSLKVPDRRSSTEWLEALASYEPASVEQWNVRRALRELDSADREGSAVVVLTLAGDRPAVTMATEVALTMATAGVSTLFALVDETASASDLDVACGRFASSRTAPRPDLEVMSGWPSGQGGDLTVTTLVVDADDPTPTLPTGTDGVVVLAVSAGFASAEQLAKVAIAVSDRGQGISGLFVANPSPEDESTGRTADVGTRPTVLLERQKASSRLASGRQS